MTPDERREVLEALLLRVQRNVAERGLDMHADQRPAPLRLGTPELDVVTQPHAYAEPDGPSSGEPLHAPLLATTPMTEPGVPPPRASRPLIRFEFEDEVTATGDPAEIEALALAELAAAGAGPDEPALAGPSTIPPPMEAADSAPVPFEAPTTAEGRSGGLELDLDSLGGPASPGPTAPPAYVPIGAPPVSGIPSYATPAPAPPAYVASEPAPAPPAYVAPGYAAPGYVAPEPAPAPPAYVAPAPAAPAYVAPEPAPPAYVAPGYTAPGYEDRGYAAPEYAAPEPPPAPDAYAAPAYVASSPPYAVAQPTAPGDDGHFDEDAIIELDEADIASMPPEPLHADDRAHPGDEEAPATDLHGYVDRTSLADIETDASSREPHEPAAPSSPSSYPGRPTLFEAGHPGATEAGEEIPESQRQPRVADRPIDDALPGVDADEELPPESGEVESQRYPAAAAAPMIADEPSGVSERSSSYPEDDADDAPTPPPRAAAEPVRADDGAPDPRDGAAQAPGLELQRYERPVPQNGAPVARISGARPQVAATFGELLDSALTLGE